MAESKIGHPPMYDNPEELQKHIDDYFDLTKPDKYTITGLCLYLRFASRQSFYDYELKEEFTYTIKTARLRLENIYEQDLRAGKSPAGSIFALKNFGWIDSQSFDHTSQGNEMKGFIVNVKPFQE